MIVPIGYGQVTHLFTGDVVPEGAAVVYGIQRPGLPPGEEQVIALHDLFSNTVMPQLSNGLILTQTLLKWGPNDNGPVFEFNGVQAGGSGEAPLPPNTAYLLTKRTDLGGRMNRGRMYLPGATEGSVDTGGILSQTRFNGLTVAATALLDGLVGLESPMVILHSSVSDPTPVTSLQPSSVVATQRRRLR